MFYFLVSGMCFEKFALALDDGFMCLESIVPGDKWQVSEKQPASWVIDIACGHSRQSKALSTK